MITFRCNFSRSNQKTTRTLCWISHKK